MEDPAKTQPIAPVKPAVSPAKISTSPVRPGHAGTKVDGRPAKYERRSGERVKVCLPIGVRVGPRGPRAGCTLNASPVGALLLYTENLPVGTEMLVTNLRSEEWFRCRVMRRAGEDASGRYALGVMILGPGNAVSDS